MQKVRQRIVLVGGGHAHAVALRMFAMAPLAETELVLVSEDSRSAYSGMLPGFVEGRYTEEELFIDLRRLATASGARFVAAAAVGIDLQARRLQLAGRPPLAFDLLSLNIGSTPLFHGVPGAAAWAVPVKPVLAFVAHWQKLAARVAAGARGEHIVLTGGGAGGVELALAMHAHLRGHAKITVVQGAERLLPKQAASAGVKLAKRLRERGIELRLREHVVRVDDGVAKTSAGASLAFSALYWATDAGAPAWFKDSGLWVDEHGFARVGATLACLGQRGIFASGDCAAVEPRPLPKAGVFAVRQGRPLAENLRRSVRGEPLRAASWQKAYLALIGTGDGAAVATRGGWSLSGRWLQGVKERIDRRFVERFAALPVPRPGMGGADRAKTASAELMRCLGCGAKVSGSVLSETLRRIEDDFPDVVQSGGSLQWGLQEREDTSLLALPAATRLLQSIDYFPSLVDDPFLAGRLACVHGFSDIIAKGAQPDSAHVLAVMGLASAHLTADDLYQTLAGIATQLRLFRARLLGGHTAEGEQAAIGLMVNGVATQAPLLRKHSGKAGDRLILTKPLGTGLLFAAAMQGRCPATWLDAALKSMLQGHAELSGLLQTPAVHAATDITGFGLLGHLCEMLRGNHLRAELHTAAIPSLPGSRQLALSGTSSSLFAENSRVLDRVEWPQGGDQLDALWCDPQTCGGLLLSVEPGAATQLVDKLHAYGYRQAAVIGKLLARENAADGIDVTLHA